MMKLCYKNLEKEMILDGVTPYVLIIENPHEFYEIVNLLNSQTSYNCDDGFILSNPDTLKELSLNKHADIIIDFFNVEFNNKKIQNAINKRAVEIVNNTDLKMDYVNSLQSITAFLNKIISELDIQTSSEVSLYPIDFIKMGNLKVLEWYKNPLEMIINYINILTKLNDIDILFLVNAKQILTKDELLQLYKHCSYIKLNLILIESINQREKIDKEQVVIIDNDLCEIDY